MSKKLGDLRQRLDDVDSRLLDALAEREEIIHHVAGVKASGTDRFRDRVREEELLATLVDKAKRLGLDGYFVTRIFREIIDHSIRLQQEALADAENPDRAEVQALRVGYQGAEGSYSSMAARRHFSASRREVQIQGFDSFELMLEAVRDGMVDYGILPIENTTAGSINDAYDLLARMNLALVGEEIQHVEHCLIGMPGARVEELRVVASHPQALLQCTRYLRTLPGCKVESYTDTAMAVERVARENDPTLAAVASEQAARLHGLEILERGIANQKENFTRMVVVAARPARFDLRVPCKTSVVLATKHEHGALLKSLAVLAKHDLSLTKLESRPRPGTPWEYLFYVDFEGNLADERVSTAVRELGATASYLKVLGSYPARNVREMEPAAPKRKSVPASALDGTAEARAFATPDGSPADREHRAEDTIIKVRGVRFGDARSVIVTGPPRVESREQILAVARAAKEAGADCLRARCFHSRTSDRDDAALGYEGLALLDEAGERFDLPVITEVLYPADVQIVAEKADILEIGAANMMNKALLAEVGRLDRPVLLERGLMSSVDEWLDAADFILNHGNQQVILCARGIRTFETTTPTTLDLGMIPLVRERTHLPMIVDVSASAASPRYIRALATAAVAAGAQGIAFQADRTMSADGDPEDCAVSIDALASLVPALS